MNTDEEILKQAEQIKKRNADEDRRMHEIKLQTTMQNLVGKFFKTLDFDLEKGKLKFYRVLPDSWRNNQVKVETWEYFHEGYYKVSINTWYNDQKAIYDEEITEIDFMAAVAVWMRKVGVWDIMKKETDH
jgi:hypothetical protein